MSESYVDLTYRGLSLGRRIRLSQVRPNTGYLELPAPMPVGAQIAIIPDDGAMFEATVVWVHEQVSGGERAPGMIVSPELSSAEITAWWTARVTAADDDPRSRSPSPGGRGRPVTVRPRSHTAPTPPPPGAIAAEAPTLAADLAARVTAAAGLSRAPTADDDAARTITMPVIGMGDDAHVEVTAIDRPPSPERSLQRTGEHDVIDDGKNTMIMQSVDPASLDLGGMGEAEAAGDPEEFEDDEDTDASDPDAPTATGEPIAVPDGSPRPSSGRRKKRKQRR